MAAANQRIRDLGYAPGWLKPGVQNTIEDVNGVRVGISTVWQGEYDESKPDGSVVRTGVTVISPRMPLTEAWSHPVYAASHIINGAGELTGAALVNEHGLMFTPLALCGTSHVGATHEGLLRYVYERLPDQSESGREIPKTNLMPVIGETWDNGLSDANSFAVRPSHVAEAFDNISTAAKPPHKIEGAQGGGTGMQCQSFKGGNGSASRIIPTSDGGSFTLGCFVQSNFGAARDLVIGGVPVGRILTDEGFHGPDRQALEKQARLSDIKETKGSTLVILATDAPCLPHHLLRLCKRAEVGLVRVGAVNHSGSGDAVVAFSTIETVPVELPPKQPVGPIPIRALTTLSTQTVSEDSMNLLFYAVAECVEEAVLNSLCAGKDMVGWLGHSIKGLPHDKIRKILQKRLYQPQS